MRSEVPLSDFDPVEKVHNILISIISYSGSGRWGSISGIFLYKICNGYQQFGILEETERDRKRDTERERERQREREIFHEQPIFFINKKNYTWKLN